MCPAVEEIERIMTHVEIEYCVPCGHRDNAMQTAEAILEAFGRDLEGVQLTPGDGGVFRVSADGDVVFDKEESGYDLDAIVDDVGSRIDA